MNLDAADGTYDAAYAFEATCHAPDKVGVFKEIYRTLKPGASFAGYEWCMTDAFDPNNAEHQRIKKGIEEGDSLPDIATIPEMLDSLRAAGFEVIESHNAADVCDPETPWYLPLVGETKQLACCASRASRSLPRATIDPDRGSTTDRPQGLGRSEQDARRGRRGADRRWRGGDLHA